LFKDEIEWIHAILLAKKSSAIAHNATSTNLERRAPLAFESLPNYVQLNSDVGYFFVAIPPSVGSGKKPRGRKTDKLRAVDKAIKNLSQVLRALAALHAEGLHHGNVDDGHIMLGLEGQVVLFGAGRRPGSPTTDVLSAMDLLPPGADITVPEIDASANAARMEDSLTSGARARLSGWVRTLGSSVGHFDEVVRDVGPENDSTGLLDRYEADAPNQDVDELKDEDSSTQMNAGSALWRTLAAPPLNTPPDGRFDAVLGVPSKAIQQLLQTERLMRVDVPAVGPVEPFVVDAAPGIEGDDESTHTALAPSAELLKAQIQSKRAALVDTLTPQPNDLLTDTPTGAPKPRQVAPDAASEIPTSLLVGLVVGTVSVVGFGLWFMGLIG
jgi:hypothetical protein